MGNFLSAPPKRDSNDDELSISFDTAVPRQDVPLPIHSVLSTTVLHPELMEPSVCEHCYKKEALPANRTTMWYQNPKNNSSDVTVGVLSSAFKNTTVFPLQNLPSTESLLSQVAQEGISCLACAKVIYEKTRHLLNGPVNGELGHDTVLHHAAQCQNLRTLCHLMSLAAQEGGNDFVLQILRLKNGHGETALHQAVKSGRSSMVELLLWIDPGLAEIYSGTSALYMAITMQKRLIARMLYTWTRHFFFVKLPRYRAIRTTTLPLVARRGKYGILMMVWLLVKAFVFEMWPLLLAFIWLVLSVKGAGNHWRVCDSS